MISEFVYGGVDGTITTFAILAASIGSNLSPETTTILSLASLLADGMSMGVSSSESVINNDNPIMVGLITFLSFVIIGLIPIMVYYFTKDFDSNTQFYLTIVSTLSILFMIGLIKGMYMEENIIISGTKTMVLGGTAGLISYQISKYLHNYDQK